MTAKHRLTGGLAFGTAYTLSKTMSMINALTVYLDSPDRLYAYDANDRRHILSFQGGSLRETRCTGSPKVPGHGPPVRG